MLPSTAARRRDQVSEAYTLRAVVSATMSLDCYRALFARQDVVPGASGLRGMRHLTVVAMRFLQLLFGLL
ncbi:hypothetical protein MGALJ_35330 [Mycobacterium gallinarum]|uniref:Uncharacterized protein n=1 Tax=Mycobacterium gallinarum TaxID=39689 RepID=A0A9W4FGC4_9MYCO|nr:hypothetical protein MGALJ_35330 [Mycobacterium gallinarum]